MTQYSLCKLCGEGDLLPFYGEEGMIAYFCTSCRSKFSGYSEEDGGRASFADMANYSLQKKREEEPTLFSTYEDLFRDNPPFKGKGKKDYDPEDPDRNDLYFSEIS